MKNKRGWIRIVEAFVAVLLVTGVVLVIIDRGYIEKEDISTKVYKAQLSILREVESDDCLREDILNVEELPVSWENFNEENNLLDVKERILKRVPNYLECEARICALTDICEFDKDYNIDIYAQAVGVTATLEIYDPRQLKLFCWVK